jgi:hypothetical protein
MPDPNSPVFVRRSTFIDLAALSRLALLSGAGAPKGAYLIAEVDGELVAAAPLDGRTATLHDPALATAEVRELLSQWARTLRRGSSPIAEAA